MALQSKGKRNEGHETLELRTREIQSHPEVVSANRRLSRAAPSARVRSLHQMCERLWLLGAKNSSRHCLSGVTRAPLNFVLASRFTEAASPA